MGKRRIAVCTLAVFVAGLVVSSPSMAAATASLQRQVNQLKVRVTKLERAIDDMYACQSVIPIARYGDPTGVDEGYMYFVPSQPGGFYTTSALDYADTSVAGSFDWIISVDDSCVEARAAASIAHAWKPAPRVHWTGKTASLRHSVFR